jgi:hypothetical protein
MSVTMHKRGKTAAVVTVLLALIALNAADLCAAAAAPEHSCCPTTQDKATKHCAKLGCSMSDPALQSKLQAVHRPAWVENPPSALATAYFFPLYTEVREPALSNCDRSLSFHQLLI